MKQLGGLMFVIFFFVMFGGWIANIVKLISFDGPLGEMSMLEIARIVGIFLGPLGSVLGYF